MTYFLMIFTHTYPDKYRLTGGSDIEFNHATGTAKFRDRDTKKYVEIQITEIDYITLTIE